MPTIEEAFRRALQVRCDGRFTFEAVERADQELAEAMAQAHVLRFRFIVVKEPDE